MKQLFFNKKAHEYHLVCYDVDIKCHKCENIIPLGDCVFIHKSYGKKDFTKEYYCINCIQYHKKRVYDEFITANVASVEPQNSIVIIDFPPSLKNSGATVFSAAVSNEGIASDTSNCEVIDHCKVSKDPNRNIMPEYKKAQDDCKKLEDRFNTPLDVDKYLDELKDAKPVIEGGKLAKNPQLSHKTPISSKNDGVA